MTVRGRALLVLALVTAVCTPAARADDARISRHLERLRTLERMSGFVGRRPDRCVWASLHTELCSWILGKKDGEAWKKLSWLLHTGEQVGLICEFEVDGPGDDNWCFARPRESESRRWRVKTGSERERVPPLAQATLVSARTLPAVGIGPDQCRELPERGQSRCSWRADHDVWGHALLAASIGAYPRAKVRLECAFPSDGSDRGEDSCSVSRAD